MGPRVNLAVVGCGAIAELAHLPVAALLAQRGDLRLTALVDRDRARAEALADCWDVPQVATDWAELSPFPDAVVVALPHHLTPPPAWRSCAGEPTSWWRSRWRSRSPTATP